MGKVHWFNPENDLALASGSTCYTAPKAARFIHDAGAALPLWYADKADCVLCYGVPADWLDRITHDFNIEPELFDHTPSAHTVPAPWGWSAYTRRFFLTQGFAETTMPTAADVERIRQLAHRSTAAMVSRRLSELLPGEPLTSAAVEVMDVRELELMLRHDTSLVVKAPWSSSGRGVVMAPKAGVETAMRVGADAIRRQGSVMVEPYHEKVIDFARLYECRDGECRDLGTSVFTTDASGAYSGNLLAPEGKRLEVVGRYFSLSALRVVTDALRQIIAEVFAPVYDGVVGVDMLVTADGRLDAVVEINVRRTMGYVANEFALRYMHPQATGRFAVTPLRGAAPIADDYIVADHRLSRGTLNLVPPNRHFAFTVTVE